MRSKDVELAVETLIDLGVLNEPGLERLAGLFQGLKAFSSAFGGQTGLSVADVPKKGYYAKEKLPEEVPYSPRASFHEAKAGNGSSEPEDLNQDDGGDGFEPQDQPEAPTARKRAPKGSFSPTKVELQGLREQFTVKQIAELKQVSPATVNNKLREFGLTTPGRRGRPAKK